MNSRRRFLQSSFAVTAAAAVSSTGHAAAAPVLPAAPKRQPNVIIFLSDQFRADFLGTNGENPSTRTPHLDAMAAAAKNFSQCVTNQPVCGPARSVLFTSRYATEAGVWHNGLPLEPALPTLAGELRKAGYTANLIGKWHLAPASEAQGGGIGYVKPQYRGGFLDFWEGANALEHSSHPYEGTIYDRDGKAITWTNQYRVDFLTDRAERFLRMKQSKPFLLFISQLEPHQQNDEHRIVGPHGSRERFANCFVPDDLKAQPGVWQDQIADYYGAVEAIDNSVGRVRKVLAEEGLADNTILLFLSDHGCHFLTRNQEYKRSTHNASTRIPLLIEGPGFEGAAEHKQLTGIIDIMPTLLEACGVPPPAGMKGRSLMPLLHDAEARKSWVNRQYIQISESMTGRAVRTPDWTYCVVDPSGDTKEKQATSYREYQMYDQRSDPAELVNLAGRQEYRQQADALRVELLQMMAANGEPAATIQVQRLYP